MTLAPILISFSLSVVSDQSLDSSGKAGGRALFYGTRRSTKWLGEITQAAAALGHGLNYSVGASLVRNAFESCHCRSLALPFILFAPAAVRVMPSTEVLYFS